MLEKPELAVRHAKVQGREMTSWEPDDAKPTTARKVEALIQMGAVDLLKKAQVLNGCDSRVIALNDFRTRYPQLLADVFETQVTPYKDPMRAVAWIAKLVGLKTQQVGE